MKISSYYYLCLLFLAQSLSAMDQEDISPTLPVLRQSMTAAEWKRFAKVGCGYYPIPEKLKEYLQTLFHSPCLETAQVSVTAMSAALARITQKRIMKINRLAIVATRCFFSKRKKGVRSEAS